MSALAAKSTSVEFEESWGAVGAALPGMYGVLDPAFENSINCPNHFEGQTMEQSRGNIARTVSGHNDPNSSDEADIIFISEWARRHSAKEGAALTGMTPKGFQKLQSGENAISYKKLTHWLKCDSDFATAYFAHVGLINPGEAEFVGAFSKAVNAYQRRGE